MIHVDRENNVFHLFNERISYVVCVDGFNRLETLYFGERLKNDQDVLQARTTAGENLYLDKKMDLLTPYPGDFSPHSRLEITDHGEMDKRDAPFIIRHENGSTYTAFEYIRHKIYHGMKPIPDQPSLDVPLKRDESLYNRDNVDTIEFVLRDVTANLYLHEFLSIYRDKDVIVKSFQLENKGKKVHVLRASSLQLDLPTSDYYFHHFSGEQNRERKEQIERLSHATLEIGSNYGRSSHQENPFCFLSEHENSYTDGEVIGFNLVYSGNWKIRLAPQPDRSLHIIYGINDEDFDWVLGKNESFYTPEAVMVYSHHGIDGMSQTFQRLIHENLMTAPHPESRPLLFNSWEGAYFNFTTESMLEYVDQAKALGVDLFVLDDGWFGKRDNDTSSLGDWTVNQEKIDLRRLINHVHELGMKFGLWFEPEMISPNSELFRAHPEYVLGMNENKDWASLCRSQLLLDFSSPEVVEAIHQQIHAVLAEYPVDYVKWDHNRAMGEHFSSFWPAEKQGEVVHRLTLGYYRLLGQLREEFPDIFFEGCASGGGRFDLGTLYFCPQIWCSDDTIGSMRASIQYDTSLGYPLSAISSHVSAAPGNSYRTKVDVALFGTYGYEMNPTKLNEAEKAELMRGSKLYRDYHHDVIQNGTLYHLANNDLYTSMISVSKDQSAALALLYVKRTRPYSYQFTWKLRGLDPKKRYLCHLDNKTYSGEYLMKVGYHTCADSYGDPLFYEGKTVLLILTESNY